MSVAGKPDPTGCAGVAFIKQQDCLHPFNRRHSVSLGTITYDESYSDSIVDSELQEHRDSPGSWSSVYGAIEDYGQRNIAIVSTEFTCEDGGEDHSWSTENTPDYYYAYVPDSHEAGRGAWVYIDSGYL